MLNIKKLDLGDISLIKLTTVAVVLFIITIWPAAMNLISSVNPWYFLIVAVIFAIRPFYKFFMK